ncbi:hypothetical protein [Rhizobium sp. SGZ-381]|uniref:hypothetical protein n=1 Tax=Rhizobium sp. SGZ-381 TaxID=3342800 RepID=UPI003670AEF2
MAVWTRGSAGWRRVFSFWLKPEWRRSPIPVTELPDALRIDVSAPPQKLPARQDDLWERIRTARLPRL